jgi:hypothetical protein
MRKRERYCLLKRETGEDPQVAMIGTVAYLKARDLGFGEGGELQEQ